MIKNRRTHIIVHHTGVSRFKNDNQFKATNNYHRRLWGDAVRSSLGLYGGYHYEIAADGTVGKFREDWEIGAHCKEKWMNYQSIGIAMDGSFDIEEPTKKQKEACLKLIQEKQRAYNIPDANILPHRHYATYKSCPGKNIPNDILGYLEKAYEKNKYDWAEQYESYLIENKFLVHKKPLHEPCTRAEVYKFISLLDKKYGNKG